MENPDVECLICRSPLVYHDGQREMTCTLCGKRFMSNAECSRGHYVCDSCHSKPGIVGILKGCLSTESRDPLEIAASLMDSPDIYMHGPEHHVLVGSALITACRNAGMEFDLERALSEMAGRGGQIPRGVCGLWGCCGAASSCGIAYSIQTGTSPLSVGSWSDCNLLTSECLRRISENGSPRCCKRDSFCALDVASAFVAERLGVGLDRGYVFRCGFSDRNAQCRGWECLYHPEHV